MDMNNIQYIHVLIIINALAALWFFIQTGMHSFVYVANKRLGHEVDARSMRRQALLTLFFAAFALGGYWKALPDWLNMTLAVLPLALLLIYALWAGFLLLSSGGKWN